MDKNKKENRILKWVIVAYVSLVIEKLIFISVIECFKMTQGVQHMGIGLLFINIFVVPFIQDSIWQLGGDLAMYTMIGFALTSYLLSSQSWWKIMPVFLGALAILFSFLWDLNMFGKSTVELSIHASSHLVAVALVALIGLNSGRIGARLAGRSGQ